MRHLAVVLVLLLGVSFCDLTVLDRSAVSFLSVLRARQLNVVTAESLTSGMIVSTLVDVPNFGSYVYGGHSVYNTDAKRQFLGVRTPDVYTEDCARQMARGALDTSRAMVSIAVTGNAGPVLKTQLAMLGVVDLAVSVRTKINPIQDQTLDSGPYATFYTRVFLCDLHAKFAGTRDLCAQYKVESRANTKGYVDPETLISTRHALRVETVYAALEYATRHVGSLCNDTSHCAEMLLPLPPAEYDGEYAECEEPSWVINSHLEQHLEIPEDAGHDQCMMLDPKPYVRRPVPPSIFIGVSFVTGIVTTLLLTALFK